MHIHSKYSRATSPEMNLENLFRWGQLKGIDVLGTGDFTHPAWFSELKSKLILNENGLYCLRKDHIPTESIKPTDTKPFFLITTEISCFYNKKGKTRKIHNDNNNA